MQDIENLIKIRDDRSPIVLTKEKDSVEYYLKDPNQTSSWVSGKGKKSITRIDLRQAIEPWLTALVQSEHLSLLIGSGLSKAVEFLAVGKPSPSTMGLPELNNRFATVIAEHADKVAIRNNRGKANIEDYIRVMNELLRGLEIQGSINTGSQSDHDYISLRNELDRTLVDFTQNISQSEKNIIDAEEINRQAAFNHLVSFLMSFASRTGTRDRLNIFTTNYDRFIEEGSELAGLHLIDRFVGNMAPIFRSSRLDIDMHYNPPGIRGEPRFLEGVARFAKIHGSIDWIDTGSDIRRIGLPFGSVDIGNYLKGDQRQVMIYPNAAKDRETSEYPYVELFRDFAVALCRPNSTLVTYGYGYGDDHVNRVIRDMLTIPSTHLVVISYNDQDGRIQEKVEGFGRSSQTSMIIGEGVADLKVLVDFFLPKPAIDRATYNMNKMLRDRYSEVKTESSETENEGN